MMPAAATCSVAREEVTAVLLGAGAGERLGGTSKPFLRLRDKTLLEVAVDLVTPFAKQVLVGLSASDLERGQSLVGRDDAQCRVECLVGGATRAKTVAILCRAARGQIVLEHDVARPLATADHVTRVLDAAQRHGAAAGIVRATVCDSTGVVSGDELQAFVPRDRLVMTRTPHAYRRAWLEVALGKASSHGRVEIETSTAALILSAGYRCWTVESAAENLKITYPEDLTLLD